MPSSSFSPAIKREAARQARDLARKALASVEPNRLAVMVWHYHDDDVPGPAAQVALTLHGIAAAAVSLSRYLVDADHSNAYELWKKMGMAGIR